MKTDLTLEEFEAHLSDHLGYLETSCSLYDDGNISEIKRLALSIRVLVHDTGTQTSLLTHLSLKNIAFVDTSAPFNERNALTHFGLVSLTLGRGNNLVLPFLENSLFARISDFETWWNTVVFKDKDGNKFTRRFIVLTLANQDGGAHVDKRIDKSYSDLRKQDLNMLGWVNVLNGEERPMPDCVPPTMRQIAHEMIKTLRGNYPTGKREALLRIFPDRKVGRNELCPCGSGKKFKKCCGQ